MTHHLALYVFQLTGTSSQPGGVDALVLARHQSPGFQLISYRRSGNNSSDGGCDLPAHNPEDNQFTAIGVDSSRVMLPPPTSGEMDVDSVKTPTDDDFEDGAKVSTTQGNAAEFYSPQRTRSPVDQQTSWTKNAASDTAFWQFDSRARQSGLIEKAKHLLILWRFLSCVSLSDAGISAATLDDQIRSHWLRVAGALRAPRDRSNSPLEGVMSSFLLSMCKISPSFTSEQTFSRDQVVVQAATNLLLRALSSRAVQYALQSAFAVEANTIDKSHLRERFISLVLDLYDVLGDLFQLGSSGASAVFSGSRFKLPTLVDEVLSLIYGRKRFSALRPQVSALLMGHQTFHSQTETVNLLFHAFTAQTRELILSRRNSSTGSGPFESDPRIVQPQSGPRSIQWIDDSNKQSLWSRRWLLEPGSIQVNSIIQDEKALEEPSLTQLCTWLHEFACVDIALRGDGPQLSIRSVVPLLDGLAPTELVADGRLRVFRVTPSGVSSMVSSMMSSMVSACRNWSIGDYSARFHRSDLLEIDFYAFQDDENSTVDRPNGGQIPGLNACDATIHVRRLRLSLVLEQNIDAETDPRDVFIIFHGVVADASHVSTDARFGNQRDSQVKPSEMLTSDRSVLLRDLQWSSRVEIHGGYVAAPAACF